MREAKQVQDNIKKKKLTKSTKLIKTISNAYYRIVKSSDIWKLHSFEVISTI